MISCFLVADVLCISPAFCSSPFRTSIFLLQIGVLIVIVNLKYDAPFCKSAYTMSLIDLVNANNEKEWDWDALSSNPSISYTDILANPTIPWNWRFVSQNPGIPMSFVFERIDKGWDWQSLSSNPSLTWSDVETHSDIPWSRAYIAQHPNMTWDILITNRLYFKSWKEISSNPNVTLENVLSTLRSGLATTNDWHWDDLSVHLSKDIDALLRAKNLYCMWNWAVISQRAPLSQAVLDVPNVPWDYPAMSCNRFLTMELLAANLSRPWHTSRLSMNPNLTLDFVLLHSEIDWDYSVMCYSIRAKPSVMKTITWIPWNWTKFSLNPHICLADVIENAELPWNMSLLSTVLPVTIAEVVRFGHFAWSWRGLSSNKHIQVLDILTFPHSFNYPWDWATLSRHRGNGKGNGKEEA